MQVPRRCAAAVLVLAMMLGGFGGASARPALVSRAERHLDVGVKVTRTSGSTRLGAATAQVDERTASASGNGDPVALPTGLTLPDRGAAQAAPCVAALRDRPADLTTTGHRARAPPAA